MPDNLCPIDHARYTMPSVEHPNILFCLFDSLSASDSGLPESFGSLPTLSKIFSKGSNFNRVYTPCPQSSPARASLFTGLDPNVHGLWTNGVTLSSNEHTFSQRLAQAGYSNYLAGRYQLAGVSRWTTEYARQNEFTKMDWAHGPLHRSRQNAYLSWLQGEAPEHYTKIFSSQADPSNTKITQKQRDALDTLNNDLSFNHWIGQCVGAWITTQSLSKPFMAIAGFCVGDLHGTEPDERSDGEELNRSALIQADTAIGELLDQLKASKRLQNTVVIVASARGNADSLNTDKALHENAIRVPLLFYGPGFKSQLVDECVSTIDIAPTVLEIANVPAGARMQGESLLGVLNNLNKPRGWALSRIRQSNSLAARNWQTALITENKKLVLCHDEQQPQSLNLFDLHSDPQQQNNLADLASHATELEQMIDQMIDARCALEDRTEPRIAEF